MKKILLVFLSCLLFAMAFLASCEDGNGGSSDGSEAVSQASSDDSSINEGSSSSDSSSVDSSDEYSESESSEDESSEDESSEDENSEDENSEVESSEDESSEDESSEPETSEPETSEPEVQYTAMKIYGCSYAQKPYFAMIGTCTEGAVVSAEMNGETISSKSYNGWFSLELRCTDKFVNVTLTQSVNGKEVGEPYEYRAVPLTPPQNMWGIVAGGDFQFFLQKMLPYYQGTNLPTTSQLNALKVRTSTRVQQLKSVNSQAELIYVVVPSAMTVYPELVPERYKKYVEETKYDLTLKTLKEAGATVIDVKSVFNEHKNDEMPLYFKLDSHWSDYGGYLAYYELFEHISKKFPQAAPRELDNFNWKADFYQSGDMTYYLNMAQSTIKEYNYYRTFKTDSYSVSSNITSIPRYVSSKQLIYDNAVTYEQKIYTGKIKLPDCMVMRDSYSTQMYDILAERMNYTHYFGMWNYAWDISQIRNENPDYVIYILAEWNIDTVFYS